MTRHLLKLVWNRKRSNAVLLAEIVVSLLVLFAVLTGASYLYTNWKMPLGFVWQDVWTLRADIDSGSPTDEDQGVRSAMFRMIEEARSFPEVVSAAGSNTPAYGSGTWSSTVNGRTLILDDVTDEFAEVMQLRIVAGRWFSREDDAAARHPVVITATAAKALFPGVDPIGRTFESGSDVVMQVVGVVADYRKDGETSPPENMVFRRMTVAGAQAGTPRNVLVRVRPGTAPDFERKLSERMQAIAPEMSLSLRRMEQVRAEFLRLRIAPLAAGLVIALFLVSMVALGLTGVLWQNVTRRTREIGLRRALGATGGSIYRQVLGEVALLTTLGAVIAAVIILQLPLLGAFRIVSRAAFSTGLIASLVMLYALTALCALYPGWLASRLAPGEALRHE